MEVTYMEGQGLIIHGQDLTPAEVSDWITAFYKERAKAADND